MLMGPRAASIPIQLVALLLGIAEGALLHYAVVGVVPALLNLAAVINGPILFLTIAFCAYFLAAPAFWQGLGRRALLLLAISSLGYAALGYLLAFLVNRGTPIGGSMPSLVLTAQAVVVAVGVAALIGYLVLRDRKQKDFLESATIPASESASQSVPQSGSTDLQGWQG